jgi:hypothetical protein
MVPKRQLMIDEAEIHQVHIKYCRGIDRMFRDKHRAYPSPPSHRDS